MLSDDKVQKYKTGDLLHQLPVIHLHLWAKRNWKPDILSCKNVKFVWNLNTKTNLVVGWSLLTAMKVEAAFQSGEYFHFLELRKFKVNAFNHGHREVCRSGQNPFKTQWRWFCPISHIAAEFSRLFLLYRTWKHAIGGGIDLHCTIFGYPVITLHNSYLLNTWYFEQCFYLN